jgi:hypothetical protein
MERERPIQRTAPASGGGPGSNGEGTDQVRSPLEDMLEAADRILDSIRPVNPEQYLQQNRQSGGQ